jgi:hypothetical protein
MPFVSVDGPWCPHWQVSAFFFKMAPGVHTCLCILYLFAFNCLFFVCLSLLLSLDRYLNVYVYVCVCMCMFVCVCMCMWLWLWVAPSFHHSTLTRSLSLCIAERKKTGVLRHKVIDIYIYIYI